MTEKELLYLEDALGHERFFRAKCKETAEQLSDPQLRSCVEQMEEKHRMIYGNLLGLL